MNWLTHTKNALRRSNRPLAWCAAVLILAGCTTTMSGGPAASDKKGIRYSLPAPHIYLDPQPDGTVLVSEKYLPDPNHTYTLNLNSYMSSATFDIKLVDGMLTTVNLDADSSAVAVDAVSAATELQKQRMSADEKRKTDAKQAADASATEHKTAAEAVRKQQEKLALLKGKRQFYLDHPGNLSAQAMLELDLQISQEEIQLTQLEARTGFAKGGASANDPWGAFSDPGVAPNELKVAYGPVFFRVLPTEPDGVKLVAIEVQRQFQTSTSAVETKVPAAASPLKFIPDLVTIRPKDASKELVFKASKPLERLDLGKSRLVKPSEGSSAVAIPGSDLAIAITDSDMKSLRLDLPGTLPKGVYRLDLAVYVKGSPNAEMQSVTIHWLME